MSMHSQTCSCLTSWLAASELRQTLSISFFNSSEKRLARPPPSNANTASLGTDKVIPPVTTGDLAEMVGHYAFSRQLLHGIVFEDSGSLTTTAAHQVPNRFSRQSFSITFLSTTLRQPAHFPQSEIYPIRSIAKLRGIEKSKLHCAPDLHSLAWT